ncbi:MAG TPA: efflux RND transporter periplasmic adaptor subunit [Polyangia bacterium]|nr:efflux RND transporter periplasmic adaptor subunit [Polyangia bacterium]
MKRIAWLFALVLAPTGCTRGDAAIGAGPPPPPDVLVHTVQPEDVPIYAESVGTIDGSLNAEVRARVAGVVTSQAYKEGTFVSKGQLLFTIDPSLTAAAAKKALGDVDGAAAALAKAESDLKRIEPLTHQGVASQQDLDNARAARNLAQANLVSATGGRETASANLSYTRIVAPVAGLAGIAKARLGSLVGQGEATLLTTVSQVNPVRVSYAISEQWYLSDPRKFQGGGNAPAVLELVLADGSTYAHRGKVTFADRQIDPSTGTLTVVASFPNPDALLRPGMYAKLRDVRELKKAVVCIPQRAVAELQGAAQVMVVGAGNKAETRAVVTGERVGSRWVIKSGLRPGERVIVEGLQKVRNGVVVTPKAMPVTAAINAGPAGAATKAR